MTTKLSGGICQALRKPQPTKTDEFSEKFQRGGGTVPQEGHNFVFPENGFFHLSSLFEGKILIFRGEMGLGTIFFRMYSDFKKKGLKK